METTIWFAGFYEGEGSISNDISNNMRLRVSMSQNDKTPLEIGQKIWGGTVRVRIRKSPASDKICTGHEWVMRHHESLKFIDDIKPYMKIPYKINQIDIVMERLTKGIVRRFKCPQCDNDYASPSGRRRHFLVTHRC
jgi:hypothetical protein